MSEQTLHLREIADHLEELGYELEESGEGVYQARHSAKANFVFRNSVGGVLQTAYFKLSREAEAAERYELLNDLNGMASVARFYFDDEGYLTIEGWWPRLYEEQTFGTFMDSWNGDLSRAFTLVDQQGWF